jgi:hypothetical protein
MYGGVNARIGLTLHDNSCSTCYELNSFSGGNEKLPLGTKLGKKKMAAKTKWVAKRPYKATI